MMAQNTNILFIPQKPLTQNKIIQQHSSILVLVSLLLFLLSFLTVCGAVVELVYIEQKEKEKTLIANELIGYNNELKKTDVINDIDKIRVLTHKIQIAENLLNKHIAPTGIFTFFEVTTPKSISYNDFTFQKKEDNTINVTLKGRAPNYETLAVLSQSCKYEPLLASYELTDLSLHNDGEIFFVFSGVFQPQVVSYSQQVGQQVENFQEIENTMQSENNRINNELINDELINDNKEELNEQL